MDRRSLLYNCCKQLTINPSLLPIAIGRGGVELMSYNHLLYCCKQITINYKRGGEETNGQRPTGDRSALPLPLCAIFDWLAKN